VPKNTVADIQSGEETLRELRGVQFPGSAREEMTLERQGQANSESICCSKGGLGTVQCVIRWAVRTFNHFSPVSRHWWYCVCSRYVNDSPGPA